MRLSGSKCAWATVWLTQQQMAELFDKDRTVIGRHIRNIYREEELEQNITCAKFAHMGSDGDYILFTPHSLPCEIIHFSQSQYSEQPFSMRRLKLKR